MHLVGVDLAWGQRRPTGLAVVGEDGRLSHLATVTSDEQILEVLRAHAPGPCVVAFDAPLVVRNRTGNRPAEAALNKDFARFDAGAHPTNTGKLEFADRPRAARIAEALGLDLDPRSTAPRRAIEVYPHPASVALFRLGRTLKYKDKPGRTLARMREQLLQLTTLLEGLRDADPVLDLGRSSAWNDLVEQVRGAPRKSDLRRAEDKVDAVLCAYVALFAVRRPADTTFYGDAHSGCIVTPTLPAGHTPTPREQSQEEGEEIVRVAAGAYSERQPVLREATDRLLRHVTSLIDDAGINYLDVAGRAKAVPSFVAKATRLRDAHLAEGREPGDPLLEITDQVGVRVITYLRRDVDAVAELLHDQFTVLDDRDMGRETARQGRFGYASRHLLLDLSTAPAALRPDGLPAGQPAQVQVRTVLQHAWAEFEHAIRYKGTIPEEHQPDLDRRFTLAAGLLELADREFSLIQEQLQQSHGEGHDDAVGEGEEDPRITPQEVATFLTEQYADAGWSRPDHYLWVSQLLLELGITSLQELAGIISAVDGEALAERMAYRYPPGAVRRLDDALLAVYGSRYLGLRSNSHREALLRARLEKLHSPEASEG